MSHPAGPRTGRPPSLASRGMVSTPHYLASASGLEALRRGGSAVDAAIAAGATLCVVYPHMTGLGGDGFWLIADPDTGGVLALNASGPSAQGATIDYYRQHGCEHQIPARGALAALTVPGTVDGWRAAHERFGRLPWAGLFADAIDCARNGMPISRSLADFLAEDAPILGESPEMARVYLPTGKPEREGSRLVQTDLARTLAWCEGSADYYHHIVEAVKLAFADRDEWLTDFPDCSRDRLAGLGFDAKRDTVDRFTERVYRKASPFVPHN